MTRLRRCQEAGNIPAKLCSRRPIGWLGFNGISRWPTLHRFGIPQAKVLQDTLNHKRIDNQGDQAHLLTALWAREWIHLVHPINQPGPGGAGHAPDGGVRLNHLMRWALGRSGGCRVCSDTGCCRPRSRGPYARTCWDCVRSPAAAILHPAAPGSSASMSRASWRGRSPCRWPRRTSSFPAPTVAGSCSVARQLLSTLAVASPQPHAAMGGRSGVPLATQAFDQLIVDAAIALEKLIPSRAEPFPARRSELGVGCSPRSAIQVVFLITTIYRRGRCR